MRKGCLFALLLFVGLAAEAQIFKEYEAKTFNWGGKVGFNSSFPIINTFTIDEVEATNIDIEYKVGFMASIFCRVNLDRFFVQPGVSWHNTESKFTFDLPNPNDIINGVQPFAHEGLVLKTQSVDLPVLIGYNLVKNGPYGLSFMVGPKLKYNYKVSYASIQSEENREYTNDSTPLAINIVTGVGVSVWRLFFDFSYEFGLNEVGSDFREEVSTKATEANIQIDKRTNMMSFSLGFLF